MRLVFSLRVTTLPSGEIISVSTRMHIGGDEARKVEWKNCPKCRALMTKEGIKDWDELHSRPGPKAKLPSASPPPASHRRTGRARSPRRYAPRHFSEMPGSADYFRSFALFIVFFCFSCLQFAHFE